MWRVRIQGWSEELVMLAILSLACVACGDDDESSTDEEREAGPRDHTDAGRMRGDAGLPFDAGIPGVSLDASVPFDAWAQGSVEPLPPLDLVPLVEGSIGTACALDDECDAGSCLLAEPITNTPYPGGYCTGPCSQDVDCSERGLCVPGFRGRTGSCALRCESDADCGRDGYRCRVVGDAGRCAPGPRPLPDHAVGRACASDDDCGGGEMTCATMLRSVAAPAGYCSQSCAIDDDCGADGVCINGLSVVTLPTGLCYQACRPPNRCRAGYECRSLSGNPDGPGVCAPLAD